MSTNLHLEDGHGVDVPLWQTPTFITHMCLSWDPKKGKYDGGQEGIRRRYLIWVRAQSDGVWTDHKDPEARRELIKEHCEKVQAVKRPRFWAM